MIFKLADALGGTPRSHAGRDGRTAEIVIPTADTVTGAVSGGFAVVPAGPAIAFGNSVTIRGGVVRGDANGGYAWSFDISTATHNTATISGKPTFTLVHAAVSK